MYQSASIFPLVSKLCFHCRLAPHPYPKIFLLSIFPLFLFNFIIISIYHQELIFRITFYARSQVFLFRVTHSNSPSPLSRFFDCLHLKPRIRRVCVTPSIVRSFFSKIFFYFCSFIPNIFFGERREQHLSILDPFNLSTYKKARACILILFLILYSWTIIFPICDAISAI